MNHLLEYLINTYSNFKKIDNLIPFLKNDKKKDDEKVNFILLRKIGAATQPGSCKISIDDLRKKIKKITQY